MHAPAGFRSVAGAQADSVEEPGLDQHQWRSRWEALAEDLSGAPAEALPEVDSLIEEMLAERGFADEADPEIERELGQAREVVARLEAGETVDPGDVGAAVLAYRAVFEELAERDVP